MRLHEAIPALFEGKRIKQRSVPDLHYMIGTPPGLVMFEPRGSFLSATTFDYNDLLVDDWCIVGMCATCEGEHDNDALTDICKACEARLETEGSP